MINTKAGYTFSIPHILPQKCSYASYFIFKLGLLSGEVSHWGCSSILDMMQSTMCFGVGLYKWISHPEYNKNIAYW